jgi:plastocyanin
MSDVVPLLLLTFIAPPPEPTGQVVGKVILQRKPPPARVYKLEPDMRKATREETITVHTHRVGKEGGLADCIVSLRAVDPARQRAVRPLPMMPFDKVGPVYEPRLLVVTAGTTVKMTNRNSPCNGFKSSSARGEDLFNRLIPAGKSYEHTFKHRDTIAVSCIRPYMLGWIVVVDTPWYARTDVNGSFTIADVPSGRYRITVWHEVEGRIDKKVGLKEITVAQGKTTSLRMEIK